MILQLFGVFWAEYQNISTKNALIMNEFVYRIKYQLREKSQTIINRGPLNYYYKDYKLYIFKKYTQRILPKI